MSRLRRRPPPARRGRLPRLLPASLLALALLALPSARAAQDGSPPTAESAPELPLSEQILGAPAALEPAAAQDGLAILAGTLIRQEPDPAAPALTVVDADTELPRLASLGAWHLVSYRGFKGWVTLATAPLPGVGAPPDDPRPAPADPPDAERLARAVLLLGDPVPARLGSWQLLTDVRDQRLLERLRTIAAGIPAAYGERLGLDPGSPAGQAVLLFARDEDYRAYERDEPTLAGFGGQGHATTRLAALAVGDRTHDQLGGLLVHELAHLLNRHALGRRPPAWLEEGIANDLAFSRIDAAGGLRPGTLGGDQIVTPVGRNIALFNLRGGLASLLLLRRAAAERRLVPLVELLALPWRSFVEPSGRELHYAQAVFFVRYLLDGERARLAPAFRSWLSALAAGGPSDAESLRIHLGRDWRELEAAFIAWLAAGAEGT